MRKAIPNLLLLTIVATLFAGCVAIPPLIQVQHKDNDSTARKLDEMDKRLERMEKSLEKK